MLDINVTIEGDKVVIKNLERFAGQLPHAVDSGLNRIAKGIHREAFSYLSGPGAKASSVAAGSYPVPVRTGHLRRALDWLKPGQTKSGEAGSFAAGKHEVIIYDSAIYANAVHEGKFSHRRHGKRPFLTNALQKFNQGARITRIIEDEINKEIKKQGLS